MSLGRFLIGCAALVACVGPLAWAAVRLRRRFAGNLPPPVSWLADAIATIFMLLLLSEALGVVGLLYLGTLVVVCVLVGGGLGLGLGPGSGTPAHPRVPRAPALALGAMLLGMGAVVAGNAVLGLAVLKQGSPDFDTQWYHLPIAAGFVQQHSVTALHFVSVDDLHQFFPANVELLHAVGMLAFSRDVLSMVLNLGFVALALLAAWCLGRQRGAGPATTLAVAVALALPQILYESTGSATTDVPALALGLAAIALLAHAGANRFLLLGAACAAGLTAGTKATSVGFAVVLAIAAVVLAPRERRRGDTGIWAVGLAVGGGFWYLRNAIAAGNPVPGSLGFLPSPHFYDQWGTIAHQISQGTISAGDVRHAFDFAFGPAWWAVIALAAIGLALGLTRSRAGWERAAAVAAIANAIAFVFSPFGNLPVNARFLAISLAIGLGLLVTSPVVLSRRVLQVGTNVVLLVLVAIGVHRYGGLAGKGPLLLGALTVIAGLAVVRLWNRPLPRRVILLAAPIGLLLVLGVGFAAAHRYVDRRYRYLTAASLAGDARQAGIKHSFAWAQNIEHQRIGFAGMDLNYPLYGADLSNVVVPVGFKIAHEGLRLPASCAQWRTAVGAGRYRYVVIAPPDAARPVSPPEVAWLQSDPSVRTILRPGGGVTVFRITGAMHPQSCA